MSGIATVMEYKPIRIICEFSVVCSSKQEMAEKYPYATILKKRKKTLGKINTVTGIYEYMRIIDAPTVEESALFEAFNKNENKAFAVEIPQTPDGYDDARIYVNEVNGEFVKFDDVKDIIDFKKLVCVSRDRKGSNLGRQNWLRKTAARTTSR